LVAIMDWNSLYVLSWELSNILDSDFCVKALSKAIVNYGSPEIMNTDQGAQFTSQAWIQVLNEYGIKILMDSQGRSLDNTILVRLWRSVNTMKPS
jgi:putative transposase